MRDVLERLAADFPDLKVKGQKSAYLAVNGNMFAFVDDQGRLCLRFSDTDKAAFNDEHGQGDVIQYKAVMRGYIWVPEGLLGDEAALRALFARSVDHALSLKAKPTRRR